MATIQELVFPQEVQQGRRQINNDINNFITPNFFGDGGGLQPTSGFVDITDGGGTPFGGTGGRFQGAGNITNEQPNFDLQRSAGGRTLQTINGQPTERSSKLFTTADLDRFGGTPPPQAQPTNTVPAQNNGGFEGLTSQQIVEKLTQSLTGGDFGGFGGGQGSPQQQQQTQSEFQNQSTNGGGSGGQGLGQLGQLIQLAQTGVDPKIQQLSNQQFDRVQGDSQNQQQLLQQLMGDLGGLNQKQNDAFGGLLGDNRAGGFINNISNISGGGSKSQFTDPLQEALAQTRDLNSQVQQDAKGLITANEEQSRFEEDNALVSLNDQLASRGLGSSSAAVDALTSAQQKFGRGRAQDAAKIRSQANQQQFQNQLGALNQVGRLASQGGQLEQQGLNTQLRGSSIGGQLVGQDLSQRQNLFQNAFNSERSGIQGQAELQGQINNSPMQALQQMLGIATGNENRTNQLRQNSFNNQNIVANQFQQLIQQSLANGNSSANNAAQLQASQNNANANRDAQSNTGLGQLLGAGSGILSAIIKGLAQNAGNNNSGGGSTGNFTNDLDGRSGSDFAFDGGGSIEGGGLDLVGIDADFQNIDTNNNFDNFDGGSDFGGFA